MKPPTKKQIKMLLEITGRRGNCWNDFWPKMQFKNNHEALAFLWPLASKAVFNLYVRFAGVKVPGDVVEAVYKLVSVLPKKALIEAAKELKESSND